MTMIMIINNNGNSNNSNNNNNNVHAFYIRTSNFWAEAERS